MKLFVIDPNERSREILVTRVREALRKVQLKRIVVVDGDFDVLLAEAGSQTSTAGFLGPGCYDSLEQSVERFHSLVPKAQLAVVLENNIYAEEALDLRRYLTARLMPLADLAQMAQFILDAASEAGIVSATSNATGIVAVVQFKGGVGATTVAASLAACWAGHQCSVALVDLDDANPHLTEWAKTALPQRRLLAEFLQQGEVPLNRVRELVTRLESYGNNLSVVGQPELYRESFHFKADVLEDAPSVAQFMSSLLQALRKEFDVVVVDVGRSWGVAAFSLLPLTQHVVAVMDDDAISLERSLQNLLRFYRESDDPAEFDLSKWRFVVNAYLEQSGSPEEIEAKLAATEVLPQTASVVTIPFSPDGRKWSQSADGSPTVTLYDLADNDLRTAVEQLAQGLILFKGQAGVREPVRGRFRQQVQRLARFLS